MGIYIDIIAVLIIVIAAAVAYFKGFVKTFFGFISTILAIALACLFCKTLATYIKENTEVDDFIMKSIISINGGMSGDTADDIVGDTSSGDYGEDNTSLSLAESIPNTLNEMFGLDKIKEEATTNIVNKITDIVINILSWLIIYAVTRIVLLILTLVFDGIMSLPILKTINNLTGLVLGAIMGIFRVYFILAIIYFVSNIANIANIVSAINTSTLVAQMYNNNLLINLIF